MDGRDTRSPSIDGSMQMMSVTDGQGEVYSMALSRHTDLANRRERARTRLIEVKTEFAQNDRIIRPQEYTFFCAGSLARGDIGNHSDLDLFLITTVDDQDRNRLDEIENLSTAIAINRTLGFGEFSNRGQYLKVYSLPELLRTVGSPKDDSENFFTARMLALLESRCVFNEELYAAAIDQIIDKYFRDSRGRPEFIPLFLLNDVLRYWRTLCLNYELIRDSSAPWRKKNINLKFSRMLTVFGTVLPLISGTISERGHVRELISLTPHERFARGLDSLMDSSLINEYERFLDDYEKFIKWKEQMSSDSATPSAELDGEYRRAASRFSDFIHCAVTHKNVPREYRKYLVI